ncbi:MAG: NAD-dependent succinate-semialdehyde dehydrogenase [Gammaproteobacteria bacterium]
MLTDPTLLKSAALIDGEWCRADDGTEFAVVNPATGETITTTPDLGAAETRRAIEAANTAWPAWRALAAKERAALLRGWFDLIMANQGDLAKLITVEQGKPLAESMGEVAYGASYIEWFGEESKRLYGDVIPAPSADRRYVVIRQPVGVVAAITPWNFPVAMITRKAGPALAVGCPIVVKPAEATPLSALALGELANRAGIPPGVINVLTSSSGGRVGGELVENPIVRKLSFTGSTAVGKILLRGCADTVKKVSMELGGNAPFIVFDDADLDAAVAGAMASKYRNSGQTCVCANRFLVQKGIYDDFAARLAQEVGQLTVGNGLDDGVEQGPLINEAAIAKVEQHIGDATNLGANIAVGGRRHALGGTFYEPTVLTGVTPDMQIANEETFGPVAPLIPFVDENDAVAIANDTSAGLASYFFSRDIGRIWRVAEQLEYGMVGINAGIISSEVVPFGGVKQAGLGREGSRYGLDDYVEMKYLSFGGLKD